MTRAVSALPLGLFHIVNICLILSSEQAFINAFDVGFILLRENFDTTTAMGKAMLRVALVFAQLKREQTAERIKDVFAWRAEQGLYNGGIRPFGYDSVSSELVPHKQERKVVEFIYECFLETKSTAIGAIESLKRDFVIGTTNRWTNEKPTKSSIIPSTKALWG